MFSKIEKQIPRTFDGNSNNEYVIQCGRLDGELFFKELSKEDFKEIVKKISEIENTRTFYRREKEFYNRNLLLVADEGGEMKAYKINKYGNSLITCEEKSFNITIQNKGEIHIDDFPPNNYFNKTICKTTVGVLIGNVRIEMYVITNDKRETTYELNMMAQECYINDLLNVYEKYF